MGADFEVVRQAVIGNWVSTIYPALGIKVPTTKTKKGACPICSDGGGTDRFRCDDKGGRGTWICNRCGAGDGYTLLDKVKGWDFVRASNEIAAILGISSTSSVTPEERQKWKEQDEQRRIQGELDEKNKRAAAAKRAANLWAMPSVERDCPYIERKQVKNFGCKINAKGNLLVPVRDVDGTLWNLQAIMADGHKPFLPGGRVSGCFHTLGKITEPYQIICIAEGYATAASIHEATGYTVICVFMAGNIKKVAMAIREKYPDLLFVYCADDDSAKANTGQKACDEAVAATGGIVILPNFSKVAAI